MFNFEVTNIRSNLTDYQQRRFLNVCSTKIIRTGKVDQDECCYIPVIVCCVCRRLVWFASLQLTTDFYEGSIQIDSLKSYRYTQLYYHCKLRLSSRDSNKTELVEKWALLAIVEKGYSARVFKEIMCFYLQLYLSKLKSCCKFKSFVNNINYNLQLYYNNLFFIIIIINFNKILIIECSKLRVKICIVNFFIYM